MSSDEVPNNPLTSLPSSLSKSVLMEQIVTAIGAMSEGRSYWCKTLKSLTNNRNSTCVKFRYPGVLFLVRVVTREVFVTAL